MSIDLKQINSINRHELAYLYEEIFVRRAYLRHGLHLSEKSIVFDVGANIGMFSLFVATTFSTASIYAFEPVPPIFEKLERNLHGISSEVHLFCCGLSNESSQADFTYYPGYSMMSGKTSYADPAGDKQLVKLQAIKLQEQDARLAGGTLDCLDDLLDDRFQEVHYRCRLRSLSEIIDEYNVPRIDFLKIDVQRAELDVLNGIRGDHWPLIQQIAMEVHDGSSDLPQGQLHRIAALLNEQGFRVFSEQYEGLTGTDRHNLFATRPAY